VSAWMSSPGHRANVLGDYSEVGFGMSSSATGVLYWCVDFGTPLQAGDPLSAVKRQVVSTSGPLEPREGGEV
jgi:hypothetical protein